MKTARELLKLTHIALQRGGGDAGELDGLLGDIGAYLGEPVHLGDTITIKPSKEGWWKEGSYNEAREMVYSEDTPTGLEFTSHDETYDTDEGETREFSYRTYKFPEAGPVGYLKGTDYNGSFVVEISGLRFRIDLHMSQGDMGTADGVVTFTRTDDDLTVFDTWDHAAAVAARRVQLVEQLAANEAELVAAPDAEFAEYARDDITRNKEDIAEIDKGDLRISHPFYIKVFGQPNFIQSEVFPTYEGRSGMCLASIENDWGDNGNINILFACDEDGLPCRIWTEASCC
jgi:hypothetical protein